MVNFYTFIPELITTMPIQKSKISDFEWYRKMLNNYKQFNHEWHTAKCPGIISVGNIGWIQRTYQDILITTNGDGHSFTWRSEIDQRALKYGHLMENYVDCHPPAQLFDFGDFKKNTLKSIVKIQSPWVVQIPEGYSLLAMPIPLNDSNVFTAACGILKNTNFLNVQLFWHCLNGSVVIKKGTPIQQYILIKDENIEFELKEIDDQTANDIENLLKKVRHELN